MSIQKIFQSVYEEYKHPDSSLSASYLIMPKDVLDVFDNKASAAGTVLDIRVNYCFN